MLCINRLGAGRGIIDVIKWSTGLLGLRCEYYTRLENGFFGVGFFVGLGRMIKKTKYNAIIQKLLDQCKIWSVDERVGRFYQIGKFDFVNKEGYTQIECQILYDMAISSEVFEEVDDLKKSSGDFRNAFIKLNKEGYLSVSYHDWNYEKYLHHKKEQAEKLHKQANLTNAFIGFLMLGQLFVLVYQVVQNNEHSFQLEEMQYKFEQLQLKQKETPKKDFCHSCENR